MSLGRYFVHILASRKYGALYVGMTGNLPGRVHLHRNDIVEGHTSKYRIHDLVWVESADNPRGAILREKQTKKWRRAWRIELIETTNPDSTDLFAEIAS